jgi:hypothetical protein
MMYTLAYVPASAHSDQDAITLPWVADSGWSKALIIADFERRFPGSRVVSLEPAEVTA